MKQWKVLARHTKWVAGATITESAFADNLPGQSVNERRYTAAIRGYRNWRIWWGNVAFLGNDAVVRLVREKVTDLRDRIDAGDESVFNEPGAWR